MGANIPGQSARYAVATWISPGQIDSAAYPGACSSAAIRANFFRAHSSGLPEKNRRDETSAALDAGGILGVQIPYRRAKKFARELRIDHRPQPVIS
jgi:hypothetical protein